MTFSNLIAYSNKLNTFSAADIKEVAANDINNIKEVAHLLKGHSLTMFFRTLNKLALSLESHAINNDYMGISLQIENVIKEIDNLIETYLN